MNNYNAYGDGAGYGSGGHLDGGFDNSNNSQFDSNSQGGKPRYAKQFIVPVTVKMLNEATLEGGHDGSYFTHGVELSYVRFIGVIREINPEETHTRYSIEDGTGLITIRIWNNDASTAHFDNDNDNEGDGDSNNNNNEYLTGDYVEVVATIREFNNKIQIQTQKVSKIKDFNFIPYHFLNVAKNYLTINNPNSEISNPGSKSDGLFVSDNDINSQAKPSATKSLPDRVLDFIKQHSQTMSDGVHTQFMSHELNIPIDQITDAVNNLVDDGRIFSTNDDTQFLPL